MEIKLPIKIHNRFDIEVRDVITGEIVQKGQAENIVLNNAFSSSAAFHGTNAYFGISIAFGDGTGTLSPERTTLFNKVGRKDATQEELVINQSPLISYCTKKIVLLPAEYLGATITEVGIGGGDPTIYTHALIKDSEGNQISLGPKTSNQEIIIYATVYFQPNFEAGITLYNPSQNSLVAGFVGWLRTSLRSSSSKPMFYVGSTYYGDMIFYQNGTGKMTSGKVVLLTSQLNGKIKTFDVRSNGYYMDYGNCLTVNLVTLAQNNSLIWGGWEFDKIPIGSGDGVTTLFNLPWNEARTDKPHKVYVEGVEQAGGVTFSASSITFDTPPPDQSLITADYWVDYVPKDTNHELHVQISILYGEGAPT